MILIYLGMVSILDGVLNKSAVRSLTSQGFSEICSLVEFYTENKTVSK